MATLSVQDLATTGTQVSFASVAAGGDVFANDGKTYLKFKNSNASTRTVTIAGNAFTKPGFGTISAADAAETITIPGSGTNSGEIDSGFFPTGRFNNSSGQVSMTYSTDSGVTVAVVRCPTPE